MQRYNANGGWKERVKSGFFIMGAEHMNSDLIIWPKLIHYMEKGKEHLSLSNHGKYLRTSNRNDLGLRVQFNTI